MYVCVRVCKIVSVGMYVRLIVCWFVCVGVIVCMFDVCLYGRVCVNVCFDCVYVCLFD